MFRFSRKHLIGAAFIALALTLPQPSAMAAGELDTLDKGPAVGTQIPDTFMAPDQNNKIRDFASLTGKNGLIVLFSRSFEW